MDNLLSELEKRSDFAAENNVEDGQVLKVLHQCATVYVCIVQFL